MILAPDNGNVALGTLFQWSKHWPSKLRSPLLAPPFTVTAISNSTRGTGIALSFTCARCARCPVPFHEWRILNNGADMDVGDPVFDLVATGSEETPPSGVSLDPDACPRCGQRMEWVSLGLRCPGCGHIV